MNTSDTFTETPESTFIAQLDKWTIYIIGLSLLTLVGAMTSLFLYGTISTKKVWIHTNLLAANVLYCVARILWFYNSQSTTSEGNIDGWIGSLFATIQYGKLSSAFWTTSESVDLYFAYVSVTIKCKFTPCMLFYVGWGASAVVEAVFLGVRYKFCSSWRCFITFSNYELIIEVPVLVLLFLAMIFMTVATWILLKRGGSRRTRLAAHRAAVAASVIVPQLAAQIVTLPFVYALDKTWGKVMYAIGEVVVSGQGILVAVFCTISNPEVMRPIKADFRKLFRLPAEAEIPRSRAVSRAESLNMVNLTT